MRNTIFYRVSGCLNAAGGPTSVCLKQDILPDLLRLAYGSLPTVNTAIRSASRDPGAPSSRTANASGSWSETVVSRARAKLAGSYQPAKAAALEAQRIAALEAAAIAELERDIDAAVESLQDATAAVAAENNAAWAEAL
jgi:hypothetical protein